MTRGLRARAAAAAYFWTAYSEPLALPRTRALDLRPPSVVDDERRRRAERARRLSVSERFGTSHRAWAASTRGGRR